MLHGTYLPGTKYQVISVNGGAITGTFSPLAATDQTSLMAVVSATPQYGADPSVFVVPQANFVAAAATPNQVAVAAAIGAAANAGGYGGNGALLLNQLISNNTVASAPAALNALSGEGLAGQQQSALNAGDLFARTVLGQVTFWGDNRLIAATGAGATDAAAPPAGPPAHAWISGFGQYSTANGSNAAGSASVTGNNAGFATGVDYRINPDMLAGLTAGYSSSSFSASSRITSGTADGAHFGLYGLARWGDLYATGIVGYTHYENNTTRYVTGLGATEAEKGSFASNAVLARVESGYRYKIDTANLTPFGGFEVDSLNNAGFSEASAGGAGLFGLHVNSQTVTSGKIFLGGQVDTRLAVGNGWWLSPFARVAWEHEFNTDRSITASLVSLPSGFTVSGAAAAANAAHLTAGVKLDVSANVAAFAYLDGQWSGQGNSYSGLGGLKIVW